MVDLYVLFSVDVVLTIYCGERTLRADLSNRQINKQTN
jgi:hypothetical protein